jgi:hypothetical protein
MGDCPRDTPVSSAIGNGTTRREIRPPRQVLPRISKSWKTASGTAPASAILYRMGVRKLRIERAKTSFFRERRKAWVAMGLGGGVTLASFSDE